MYNYSQSSQNNALLALPKNQKLKMRLKSFIVYVILICTTNCGCLAFQEQQTTDLTNRTLNNSTDLDASSKLISSSITNKKTESTHTAESLHNTQPELATNLTPPSTNNVTQDKLLVSTNSPPAEQLSTSESRESPASDFNNFNYNYNQDESQDGSDLNFSLMNAPHDKLQAVKHLLNTERSILASQNQQQQRNDQSTIAQGVSQQCTYKGKQYSNGQNVPIEEQPCLNCTCKRAILQCYLRVCPPIISLEAHKRMQLLTKQISGENCRMVKEAHQCCPSFKCDPIASDETSRHLTTVGNFSSPVQFVPTPPTAGRFGATESDVNTVSVGSDMNQSGLSDESSGFGTRRLVTIRNEGAQNGLVLRIQQQPVGATANRSVNESRNNSHLPSIMIPTTFSDSLQQEQANLPKLTVIKGASGQPDSILLITSNPSSVNNIVAAHENDRSSTMQQTFNTSYGNNQHQAVDRSATAIGYSDALLNALLETVYSSVAQLNGLNLQGSCMINGSLYVEGSAVMPEGNAYCQYCYCIRQKIMCVKPKCHLMISGCSPKYSNEYACCPTSYSCTNSDTSSTNSNNVLPGLRSSSISASQQLGSISSEPQNLSAKLSAAIDSISRMSPSRPERQATPAPNDAISARQVDGTLTNPDSLQSTMLSLMNSIGLSTTNSMNDKGSPTLNKTSSTEPLTFRTLTSGGSGSTTSAPTTTTTTTTTTSPPSTLTSTTTTTTTSSTTTSAPSRPTSVRSTEEDSNEDDGNEEEGEGSSEKQQDKSKNKKVDNSDQLEMDKELKSSTSSNSMANNLSTNTTTEQPSSVSDFLEPMNRLGPLIMSLATASNCNENGRQYAIGVQIPTLEACKHCYCGLEGVKECKKVECGLKTPQRNGCKPVTPEGHCCPIRYDCPPLIPSQIPNQRSELSPSSFHHINNFDRYRFESEAPISQRDISQCTNESGEACSNNSNKFNLNYNHANQEGNSEIENIKGLSEITDQPPVIQTTRIVPPNWTPSVPTVQSTFGSNGSSNTGSLNGLTEELNKFIMQINQNITSNNNQATKYSMIPSNNGGNTMNDTHGPVSTHEMMINDQHSKMVDYHSVQAPPGSSDDGAAIGIPSIVPEPIRNLMKGGERVLITNGEIVPVADQNLGGKLLASTVEYAMNDNNRTNYDNYNNNININELNQPANHQAIVSGSRDSRSTNAHRLNEIYNQNGSHQGGHFGSIELANLSLPLNTPYSLQQLPPSITSQPENVSDDYIDGDNNNKREIEDSNLTTVSSLLFRGQNVSNSPNVRLMRNNHNLPPEATRFTNYIHNNPNTLPLVVFDDSVSNNNNSMRNQNNPNNAYTTIETNNNNQTQPSAFGKVEMGRPVATSPNEDEENSTPTPPQPTTGTPIGLDADRGPETRGWLKSLSGLVHSFGRRLVPGTSSTGTSELDGAASDGKYRENQARQAEAIETARSKQPSSLFNHLMQMLSNAEQPPEFREEPSRSLVMRPLASVVQVDSDVGSSSTQANLINSSNRPRTWPPILSSPPYEPVGSSEIEIVTAAVPSQFLEPELPETTLAKVAESEPRNGEDSFAKRSDVAQDTGPVSPSEGPVIAPAVAPKIENKFLAPDSRDYPFTSEGNSMPDRSTFNRANKQLIVSRVAPIPPAKPQSKPLTCYDPVSNKTYQANENWIPSDDYCKTCTCILGEERCQTLTCPEKPAENCIEEKRSGECCASYTCGTNLGGSGININQVIPSTTTTIPTRGNVTGSNARMMMPLPNNQQMATPRAINTGQTIGNNNMLEFNQQRGPINFFSQQPGQVRNQNSMANFQQIQQAPAGNNQGTRNEANIDNMRRQQLPQHPFRVNDLPNILPPHLRFRPNLQGSQLASSYHSVDSLNQNKVLFFNQGSSSDQRFPLQNFISRRNDNTMNIRIPINEALNRIDQKPSRTSSSVNPAVSLNSRKAATLPSSAFNQPFNGQAMNKNNFQSINNGGDNNWRSTMMNDNNILVTNGANLPSNILIPRMSGEQQTDNNLTGPGSSPANWQPSTFMMPSNPSQPSVYQPQISTPVTPPSKQTTGAIEAESNASVANRILFQVPPTDTQLFNRNSASSVAPPSVDSGFRPIMPISTTQRSNNLPATQEASTISTRQDNSGDPTTRLLFMENRQQFTDDSTKPIEVNSNRQQNPSSSQIPARDTALINRTEYLSSSPATTLPNSINDDAPERPKESDQSQSGHLSSEITSTSISTTSSNYPSSPLTTTTSPSTSTTELGPIKENTKELTSSSLSSTQPTETTSADQTSSFDPMSMFRVSECNIYGRIYPVGQMIKELSDSCKRCTCTSMGVECENKC